MVAAFHSISFDFILVTFISLFTIVNPLGATLIFLVQAGHLPPEKMRSIATRASLACLGVLICFGITGEAVFRLMGITIPAFQIAGGILIFTVALDMLKGMHVRSRTLPEEQREAVMKEDISIIPLGIPLLAGPGAITTVIVLVSRAKGPLEVAVVFGSIVMTTLLTQLILSRSTFLLRVIGPSGIRVANRLMGLIVAAIAVQFVLNGVENILPTLAKILRTT